MYPAMAQGKSPAWHRLSALSVLSGLFSILGIHTAEIKCSCNVGSFHKAQSNVFSMPFWIFFIALKSSSCLTRLAGSYLQMMKKNSRADAYSQEEGLS